MVFTSRNNSLEIHLKQLVARKIIGHFLDSLDSDYQRLNYNEITVDFILLARDTSRDVALKLCITEPSCTYNYMNV